MTKAARQRKIDIALLLVCAPCEHEGRRQDFDIARQAARDADPMFYQKLVDAKKQTSLTR